MPVASKKDSQSRVVLREVTWETYESLLRDLEDRRSPHIAFDQGVMEIVSPHADHEEAVYLIASVIEIALEEMDVDFRSLGSTTFRRKPLRRGFEPDACFYIQNVERIRTRKRIDLETDPPPDLIVEVDLTTDSLNKTPIYGALGVREVWRYDGECLDILVLNGGRYVKQAASASLPMLTTTLVLDLLAASPSMKRPAWLREVRRRVSRP